MKGKTMKANSQSTRLIGASLVLAGICGCGLFPIEESVLKGTWELELANPPELLTQCLMTIDGNGEVTQVSYTFVDRATVTWNHPTNEVIVEDDQIEISVLQEALGGGQGFTFTGTLDSTTEPTLAPGLLNLDLALGDTELSVVQGEATLVKQ
jgi:hypothetical protein